MICVWVDKGGEKCNEVAIGGFIVCPYHASLPFKADNPGVRDYWRPRRKKRVLKQY